MCLKDTRKESLRKEKSWEPKGVGGIIIEPVFHERDSLNKVLEPTC